MAQITSQKLPVLTEKDQLRRELIDMLKKEVEDTRTENIPGLRDLGVADVARVREFACMLVEEAMLNWKLADRQKEIDAQKEIG